MQQEKETREEQLMRWSEENRELVEIGLYEGNEDETYEFGEIISCREAEGWHRYYGEVSDEEGLVHIAYVKNDKIYAKKVPKGSIVSAQRYLEELSRLRGWDDVGIMQDGKTGEGNFYPKVLAN